MDAKTFFQNFHTIAQAPNGVAKLREMILQLAVQGKLVSQAPKDEPASVLLEKIKQEKEKLINEGKIKNVKPILAINDSEVPFDLPEGWEWKRFGEVTINRDGERIPVSREERKFRQGPYDYYGASGVIDKIDDYLFDKPLLLIGEDGANLINRSTPIAFIASGKYWVNNHAHVLDGITIDFLKYLELFINAIDLKPYVTGTAQPKMNQAKMNSIVVAFPPEAEQSRIVSKVDELMKLCDELEARERGMVEVRSRANYSALDCLMKSEGAREFADNWKRIAHNFDLLYDNPENVSRLRQAILQLAVQGKLVPQNPKDQPASVLLEKIKQEKEKLVKEGKIKKGKSLPEIESDILPFETPVGWAWERLGVICELITKGSSPKWQGVSYVDDKDGILFITSENVGNYRMILDKRKYVEKEFNLIEPRSILQRNDILMNIVGASIGRTAIYDVDELANVNQAVCLIRFIKKNELVNLRYFLYFFNSPFCISMMFDKQVDMARANLSMGNISRFTVPIPPLSEQTRIVSKVDELMSLCDSLESSLQQSRSDGERLMESSVSSLLAG